jgi:hypothetical protein
LELRLTGGFAVEIKAIKIQWFPFTFGDAIKKAEDSILILQEPDDAIEARAEDIALLESWDTGQALKFMSKAALRGAENFRFFADRAPDAAKLRKGETRPSRLNGLEPLPRHRTPSVPKGLDPVAHFTAVVRASFADQLPRPWALDEPGRRAAGFVDPELRLLSEPRTLAIT